MNCKRIYQNLISKAQKRIVVEGYFEKHHVIPKSLGGTNDKSNLVKLTAREHFIAHWLLAKIYGGNQWVAVIRMSGEKGKYYNSKLYEIAKRKMSEEQSGSKNRMYGKSFMKGRKHSEETKRKISDANKNKEYNKSHLGKKLSEETKNKMSKANLGKKLSEETKAKLKESRKGKTPMLGKTHSKETKRKMSISRVGKTHSEETKNKLKMKQIGKTPMLGKKHSEETKKKMREARQGFSLVKYPLPP